MGKGGMSAGAREVFRIILWMCYVTQLLINSVYVILDCITFSNVWQVSGIAITDAIYNNQWRAPLSACLLSSILTLSFNILTCIVLLKKSINRSGPGFGYGFVLAYYFTMAFFCLLCSLVLDGFRSLVSSLDTATTSWTYNATQIYTGTEILGFVCTGVYLLFALILLIFQNAIGDHLGMDMSNPYEGLPDIPSVYVPNFDMDIPDGPVTNPSEPRHSGAGQPALQNSVMLNVAGSNGQYSVDGASSVGGAPAYSPSYNTVPSPVYNAPPTPAYTRPPEPSYSPPSMYSPPPNMVSAGYPQPIGYQAGQHYTTYENQEYEEPENEASGLIVHENPSYNLQPNSRTF